MKFTEWNFDPRIQKAVDDLGFIECTSVQEETYKLVLEGRDIQAQSQTGTGKTAAFMIGAFHLLLNDESLKNRKVLVVAPTRELADQIEKEALALGKYLDFKIGSFYGGVGYKKQEDLLRDGVDVIIGTPGRLIDFHKNKKIDFRDIGILIIDEADRLFDMGFYPDIRKMLEKMGPKEERKSFLFSATMSSRVATLAWEFMNNPGDILIEPEQVTVDKIKQELYHISKDDKISLLLGLMKKVNPKNGIIFTNTKHDAVKLSKRLSINGYKSAFIIGDLAQPKRLQIIKDIKSGALPFLVATDVAARGLHVDDLEMVINFDLPNEAENYVHRIGRTARAGSSGLAISLACEKYVFGLKDIEDYIGMKIPVSWPGDDDFIEDKSAGMAISSDHKDREVRSGRRDDRNRGGERKRDLIPREKRKRSQDLVSQATGAGAMEEKARKNQSNTPARSKGERPPRRPAGNPRQDRKRDLPPPNIKRGSMEDRLAYYKKKYGDDFKALEGTSSPKEKKEQPRTNNRNERPKNRPRPKRENERPRERQPVPEKNREGSPAKESQGKEDKNKSGLLDKLFGWMKKKK